MSGAGASARAAGRPPQISFDTTPKLVFHLEREAKARGISRTGYAKLLFNAAWAARHGETGDRDLDATVCAVMILHAERLDAEAIGRALGCSAATARRIIGGWNEIVDNHGGLIP